MGDLQVGELFRDKVFLIETATGNPHLLQTPTVVVIDELGNRAAPANATEESDGWYYYEFTPDAAGTWSSEWANAGSTFINNYIHYFKVGGGEVTDIKTETATILADTNELQTDWVNGGRLDLLVDAIKAKTDSLPADPADDSDIDAQLAAIDGFHDVPVADTNNDLQIRDVVGRKTDTANTTVGNTSSLMRYTKGVINELAAVRARTDRHEITKTFFSSSQISVTLTNVAGDKSLPTVTLPNITGTITHVYAGFKFRMIENTNAAANKLDAAQDIQVRVDTPGAWADAINFVDDQFGVAATTREGGDCVIGTIDLVGTVTAFNDGYEFQWDEGVADQSNLVFNDVQTFLIVSYY